MDTIKEDNTSPSKIRSPVTASSTSRTKRNVRDVHWSGMINVIVAISVLLCLPKTCRGIQSLHYALVNDNLPQSSTLCDTTSPTSVEFDPTNLSHSDIHDANDQYEFSHVFLMQMLGQSSSSSSGSGGNFTIRVARGGNLYSYVNEKGQELMAPQSRVESPYNDEVWQVTLTDREKHNPDGGEDMIIHQAGPYLRMTEENTLTEPWMSPELTPDPLSDVPDPLMAIDCQANSCSFASWGQQSDLPTPFSSGALLFQRYANCGDGVLEHTTSIYNMPGNPITEAQVPAEEEQNDDEITFLASPWFGVRPSVLSDVISTDPDTLEMFVAEHNPAWVNSNHTDLDDTAGFTILSETVRLRNPGKKGLPCGHPTANNGKAISCNSTTTSPIPLYLKIRTMHDYTSDACAHFGYYSNLYNITAIMCRLDDSDPEHPVPWINDGTYNAGGVGATHIQFVADDPSFTGSEGTDEESFLALDLHPFRAVLHWSYKNSVSGRYYTIFSPRNPTITAADINALFKPGMVLNITETPEYELPCAFANGTEAPDCDPAKGAVGRPTLALRPWYSGATYSCKEMTSLSEIYGHQVAYCRLEYTMELKNNLGSRYEPFTLMSINSGATLDLDIYGVLHWAYKNPAGDYYLMFFVGSGGMAHVNEVLLPYETLKVYRNVGGKAWNHNHALSLVHGNSRTLNEASRSKKSVVTVGMTGSPERDFMPMSVSTFPNITVGSYLSKRQYIINSALSQIKNKSLDWVDETTQNELLPGEIFPSSTPTYTVNLFSYGGNTFGGSLSTDDCSQSQSTVVESCVGSTVPLTPQHLAHFAISCGNDHHYVGTNRYHFSPLALQSDVMFRPWLCMDAAASTAANHVYIDNNITLRPKFTFLGFFLSGDCDGLQGMQYSATLCNASS